MIDIDKLEKIKKTKTKIKKIILGTMTISILATGILSDAFLNPKIAISKILSTPISYNINLDKNKLENFSGIVVDSNGLLEKMYIIKSVFDNNSEKLPTIEITSIDKNFNTFSDKITLSEKINKDQESSFLSKFVLFNKLTVNNISLEFPKNLKEIVNVDVDNDKPVITYKDNRDLLNLITLSRYNVLNNANEIFLYEKDLEKLSEEEKSKVNKITNEGLQYNGKIVERYTGNEKDKKFFLLPEDCQQVLQITTNVLNKNIFYKSYDGNLKLISLDDLNFNKIYTIKDSNNNKLFQESFLNFDFSFLDKNKKIKDEIINLNIDKEDLKEIISMDRDKNSLEITYLSKDNKIKMKESKLYLEDNLNKEINFKSNSPISLKEQLLIISNSLRYVNNELKYKKEKSKKIEKDKNITKIERD